VLEDLARRPIAQRSDFALIEAFNIGEDFVERFEVKFSPTLDFGGIDTHEDALGGEE
jgi:hypothetical protein